MSKNGDRYSIGEAARRAGCKIPTVRYYESVGLLDAATRSEGGHRVYRDGDVRRLTFIRRIRELGFSLEEAGSLLALASQPDRSCAEVDAIATAHLASIDERIASLTAMRGALHDVLEQCARTTVIECRVLDALAPPAAGEV